MVVEIDDDFNLPSLAFDNLNNAYLKHIREKHNIPNYIRVETYDGV